MHLGLPAFIKELQQGLTEGRPPKGGATMLNHLIGRHLIGSDWEQTKELLFQPLPLVTKKTLDHRTIEKTWRTFYKCIRSCTQYTFLIKTDPPPGRYMSKKRRDKICTYWNKRLLRFTKITVTNMMKDSVAEQAITMFVVSAFFQLFFLQEMALIDPTEEQPSKTHAARMIKQYARQYQAHVLSVFNRCLEVRKAGVSEFEVASGSAEASFWDISWTDSFSCNTLCRIFKKDSYDPEYLNKEIIDLKNYNDKQIKSEIEDSLPFVLSEVTSTFKKLIKNPLPPFAQRTFWTVVHSYPSP